MSEEVKNFLGIDWGERKIGLALAHNETRVAIALPAETNDEALLERISTLIAEESIGTVIIGIAKRRMEKTIDHPAAAWALTLTAQTGVRVEYVDEMFTSTLAQAELRLRGEKNPSSRDDSEAAKILLQGWLESKGRTGRE